MPKTPCASLFKTALGVVFALVLGAGFAPSARAQEELRVVLLGTGSPPPTMQRFGPATLVTAGGRHFLFDAGRGATQRLWQRNIPVGRIEALLVTHLHSDHVVGIPDVWLTGWLDSPFGTRSGAFRVFGPAGTSRMMEHLRLAYDWDVRTRIEDQGLPEASVRIDARDIGEGIVFDEGGVRIMAFKTDHGDKIDPTLGYRVDFGGLSAVVSGDTRYSETLIRHSRGVDILVHSVGAARPELIAAAPMWGKIMAHHIEPEDAGRVFAAARPKMAAFTHIVTLTNGRIPPVTPEEILERTRTTYDGPLVVGVDQMVLIATREGVRVERPNP